MLHSFLVSFSLLDEIGRDLGEGTFGKVVSCIDQYVCELYLDLVAAIVAGYKCVRIALHFVVG